MLPNELYYGQIKTVVKINDGQTDQDKSVLGSSVDESLVKTDEGQTDRDKGVPGNPIDESCKYTKT